MGSWSGYRRIIRLQAQLGRPDAARRTYRLLETRLADLDVEPDDATDQLLHEALEAPRSPQAVAQASAMAPGSRSEPA